MVTPRWIDKLALNEVFVFGSNEAGRHGAGAAKQALRWGAKYGQGVGLHGRTYAIPTKNKQLKVLSLPLIKLYVNDFIAFAAAHPHINFLVTEIGCGLAGYSPRDIAPMFKNAVCMNNVSLPQAFLRFLCPAG